jgi:dihydrofolate synthase/folylpolyglutamate synthase
MNYRQTLDYLFAQLPMFHRIGAAAYRTDLNNTKALCSLLNHPENSFKSVHIAGTNGKGSTSHLIASVLQSAGYKTGLYTSPHLKDFRERIRVNGKKIPKSYVSKFVAKNKNSFEPVQPSFFEYTAVMAFQYFAEEKVDIAIIETGMGGRLDSTNVITPVLSVITNISKDHTAFLGNTLPAIATEKAGIIKQGIPVVIGETQAEVEHVFIARAKSLNSSIIFADQLFNRDGVPLGRDGVPLGRDGVPLGRDGVPPLKGIYQEKNIITSYQALRVMQENGFNISEEHIRHGFRNVIKQTGLQGRWQMLSRNPRTICDVAHNEAGISYIIAQLTMEKFGKLHWVFGLVNDKDAGNILRLLPPSAEYYFCKADIPRGLDAGELRRKANAFGLKGKSYPSVQEAYLAARQAASFNDLVFIGGSTFVVAEVI